MLAWYVVLHDVLIRFSLVLVFLLLEEKDSLLERRNFDLKILLNGAEDLDNCSVKIVQSL